MVQRKARAEALDLVIVRGDPMLGKGRCLDHVIAKYYAMLGKGRSLRSCDGDVWSNGRQGKRRLVLRL